MIRSYLIHGAELEFMKYGETRESMMKMLKRNGVNDKREFFIYVISNKCSIRSYNFFNTKRYIPLA